jgi:hypothetical protein
LVRKPSEQGFCPNNEMFMILNEKRLWKCQNSFLFYFSMVETSVGCLLIVFHNRWVSFLN